MNDRHTAKITRTDATSAPSTESAGHRSGVYAKARRDGGGGWGLVLVEHGPTLGAVALQDGAIVGATSKEAKVEGEGVAAEHLRVIVRADGCYFEDLGSTGGTYVGGVRAQRIGVLHGDVVRLGQQLAVFVEHDLRAYAGAIERVGGLLVGPKQRADWASPVVDLCSAGASVCVEGPAGTGKRTLVTTALSARKSNTTIMVVDGANEGHPLASRLEGSAPVSSGAPTIWLVLAADRLPRARQVELMHAVSASNGSSVVATTRVPLDQATKDGLFSPWFAQLFSGKRVAVPPLQARREDIPALVWDMAERRGIGRARISAELLETLVRAGWPGGVPELEALLVAAADATPEGALQASAIAARLARPSSASPSRPPSADPTLARARLEDALARANGSVASAARGLGMSRQAIYREAERLGLNIAHRKTPRT